MCIIMSVLAMATGLAVNAIAEDNPETIIKTASAPVETPVKKESPEDRWQKFLAARNLNTGVQEGGVTLIPDRDIIISSASEFTKVGIGQPGWVESRVVAFERAELEAKAKIIRYLSETVETKRSLELLENAAWSDGSVQEVKRLGEVQSTLERIGKKSLDLTESALDKALQKMDPDYDAEKYADKTPQELKVIVQDTFTRHIRSMAFRTLIGVTPIYTAESKVGSEYHVLIGVIWSPKLNRLALSLFNGEYNIPAVAPGAELEKQLPGHAETLLGTWGTRIVIDENGHYAVLAYAQSQPRSASSSRLQAALQTAKEIAANRARAQIVNYIKEGLTVRDEEKSSELSREFSDMTVGTETVRKYYHRIAGRKIKVKLRGLRVLKQWDMEHPETGQKVAGSIVAWSPSSAALSEKIDSVMKARPKAGKAAPQKTADDKSGAEIESMPVDTSKY
jgi:hypothetical protein